MDYFKKHDNVCYKKLGNSTEVKEPELRKPAPSKFDPKCSVCDKTFKTKRNLEQNLT